MTTEYNANTFMHLESIKHDAEAQRWAKVLAPSAPRKAPVKQGYNKPFLTIMAVCAIVLVAAVYFISTH